MAAYKGWFPNLTSAEWLKGRVFQESVISRSVAAPFGAQPSRERKERKRNGPPAGAMGRYSGRSFRLVFMCVVSILLFVMELAVAHIGNSLSLASDAFAVLSHLLSMVIGLFSLRASTISRHRKSTFGFLRADVVGAFGNSIFAVALMFSILVEAIKRYINPQKTEEALLVLLAGIVGLFFNVLNYVILDCCYCSAGRPPEDPGTGKPCRWTGSVLGLLVGPVLDWGGLLRWGHGGASCSPDFAKESPPGRSSLWAGWQPATSIVRVCFLVWWQGRKKSRQVEKGRGGADRSHGGSDEKEGGRGVENSLL